MNGGAIVLADEPTGALDHASGRQVMAELKRLHAQGHTVILVTHDAAIAAHASRVIEIADGQVVSDRGMGDPAVARSTAVPERSPEPAAERRAPGCNQEAARMAVRSMLAHRLRTLLTMLGIIIGVAAVVTVVALGKGAQAQVESQINELGASTLDIFPGADFGDPRSGEIETLVVDDADHLAALSYVDSVSPNLSGSVAALQGNRRANTQVLGVGADLPRVRGLRLKAGRFFTDAEVEAHRAVGVVDQKAAKALFNGNPIGGTVLLGGMPVELIGVVGPNAFAGGATPTVYVPYTSASSRLLGSQRLESITVRVRDDVPTTAAEASLGAELQRLHGRRDFFIYNADQIRKAVMKSSQTMAALVSAIAAVALVVGGVGVMNIMLVSVKERVREIGVRLAVGARQGDILRQFLIEAVLICLFGGVLGCCSRWLWAPCPACCRWGAVPVHAWAGARRAGMFVCHRARFRLLPGAQCRTARPDPGVGGGVGSRPLRGESQVAGRGCVRTRARSRYRRLSARCRVSATDSPGAWWVAPSEKGEGDRPACCVYHCSSAANRPGSGQVSTTMNSSPPIRTTLSIAPSGARRKAANSTSTVSPRAWPCVSLICLK